MKRGILTCFGDARGKNIGDYIQSVAAAQFAGSDAVWLERERLDTYDGPPVKVVMNAWFMHHPERFPPSPAIQPLFLSFHVRPALEKRFFTSRTVDYLKAHEPIGCRSSDMVHMLDRHGIKAEFTSCATLTLGERFHHAPADVAPLFVDPYFFRLGLKSSRMAAVMRFLRRIPLILRYLPLVLRLSRRFKTFRHLSRIGFFPIRWMHVAEFLRAYLPIFDKSVLLAADYVSHSVAKEDFPDDNAMFACAEELLHRYEKVPFVVTSRLHCALPCTAMGTPVWVVVHPKMKTGRFGGNDRFFNMLQLGDDGLVHSPAPIPTGDGKIHLDTRPPVRTEHLPFARRLAERMRAFFSEGAS